MLGALGGMSVVALVLVRDDFRPAVFLLWTFAALVMWLHANGFPA